MTFRQFAAGVPELFQVAYRSALGGFHAERGQAASAAGASLMVLALGFFIECKEGLGVGDGGVDDSLVKTVIGHNGKAVTREGCAQCIRKALEVGIIAGHRDRYDGLGVAAFGSLGGDGAHNSQPLIKNMACVLQQYVAKRQPQGRKGEAVSVNLIWIKRP